MSEQADMADVDNIADVANGLELFADEDSAEFPGRADWHRSIARILRHLAAEITRLTAAHRHAAEELQVVRASREQCQAEIFNLKDEIEAEQFQGVEDDLEITRLKSEIERLREALRQIANGDGYYGAQAREYKEIARRSLSSLSGVGASADQTAVP